MHEQLEEYLNALDRDDCYRVDSVLKESPYETTELVFFVGANGAEQGPFIRKRFDVDLGLGSAYGRLWEAQRSGRRFMHVPRMIECYSAGDTFVVVMECVVGETLADAVWRSDASLEFAAHVFGPVCEAVMELHERFEPPMIHRDLKPSNIMLCGAEATVIDFGIAREYDESALADTHSFGTRSYAPPEQFGYGQTDVRSDVYALGLILYYCLTEMTPDAAVVRGAFADEEVPDALRPVLVRATAFDPAARYGSVRELRDAFQEAVDSLRDNSGTAVSRDHASLMHQSDSAPQVPQTSQAPPTTQTSQAITISEPASFPSGEDVVRRSRLPRIPDWIGRIWNWLLLVVWAFFVLVVTMMIVEPSESLAEYAPWGRWVMGYGIIGVGFGITGLALMDKRRLALRFPALQKQNPFARFVVLLAVALVAMMASAALAQASMGF